MTIITITAEAILEIAYSFRWYKTTCHCAPNSIFKFTFGVSSGDDLNRSGLEIGLKEGCERGTVLFVNIDGAWKIVHEHCSDFQKVENKEL